MAKKRRKDKEVARLRREVEVLRAQLSSKAAGQSGSSAVRQPVSKPAKEKIERVVIIDIRPDLRKTAILTAVCLGILFVLYLTQSRLHPFFTG